MIFVEKTHNSCTQITDIVVFPSVKEPCISNALLSKTPYIPKLSLLGYNDLLSKKTAEKCWLYHVPFIRSKARTVSGQVAFTEDMWFQYLKCELFTLKSSM